MNDSPHIWTRRPKIIEPRREIIVAPRMAGFFKLEAVRPDGRRRMLADWFPNLILDVGLDLPGQNGEFLQQCAVGTGSAAPDEGDTSLAAQVAITSTRTSITSGANLSADRYTWARTVFRFSTGAAAGNLAEIGIKCSSPATFLSRALILDGGGDPTTITVLSDEVLDATYEFRLYPPLIAADGTMTVSGDDYDVSMLAAEVDSLWNLQHGGLGAGIGFSAGNCTVGAHLYPSTSTLGTVTTGPSGSPGQFSSGASSSYSPGSHVQDFSYTWNLDAGNVSGGAAAVRIAVGARTSSGGEATSHMCYQMSVDPPLPKNSGNNLVLNFRSAWARRVL